jgi:hypothetical protein
MRSTLLLCTLGALAVAGCGGSGAADPQGVVKHYLGALSSSDWGGACNDIAKDSKAKLEVNGRKCPEVLATTLKNGRTTALLKGVTVGHATVAGSSAKVPVTLPSGQSFSIPATKEDGNWRVQSGSSTGGAGASGGGAGGAGAGKSGGSGKG